MIRLSHFAAAFFILLSMKNERIITYRISVKRPGLKKGGIRAAFISDLHNVYWENDRDVLPDLIAKEHPDLILIGGDIITARPGCNEKDGLYFVRRMMEIGKVYFALGNHEHRSRLYKETYGTLYKDFTEPLLKEGLTFLDNRKAEVTKGGIRLGIYGLSISREKYERFAHTELSVSEINEWVGRPDRNELSILLAHNPKYYQAYLEWGADLTLCGHYHGGIMRIGKHYGLVSPDFRPFPDHAYGRFRKNGKNLIITSGAGEHSMPLRLNNPREAVILDIRTNNGE